MNIELEAWKMYFNGAVNRYRNGIGVFFIILDVSNIQWLLSWTLRQPTTWHNMKRQNEISTWASGKGSQSLWGYNVGYSSSPKVMEGEGRASQTIPIVLGKIDKNLWLVLWNFNVLISARTIPKYSLTRTSSNPQGLIWT